MTWIITGDADNSSELIKLTTASTKEDFRCRWKQLVDCYILGDFLGATGFKNFIIDKLVSVYKEVWEKFELILATRGHDIAYVCSHTPRDSKLRRLIRDLMTRVDHPNKLLVWKPGSEDRFWYLVEHCHELLKRERRGRGGNDKLPWGENPCRYHEHPGRRANYTCKK